MIGGIASQRDSLHLGIAVMNATLPDNGRSTGTRASSELRVEGMTCNNCARHVTEAIQSVPGVSNASVSLAVGQASVRWQEDAHRDVAALVEAIQSAGYEAKPLEA